MNVYDFDKTIYKKDSTALFYFYCLKTKPKTLLWLPYQAFWGVLFLLKIVEKTAFKQRFYKFFTAIDDIDATVLDFWTKNKHLLQNWYLQQKNDSDIIISASPYFLLKPILTEIGIENLIASPVDKYTGKYSGLNCHGQEKVTRFYSQYPNGVIDNFYSDSLSDTPLAKISKNAFLVNDTLISEWPFEK